MRLSAHRELAVIAENILKQSDAIAAQAEEELAAVRADEETKPDVLKQREAEVYTKAAARYHEMRAQYAPKINQQLGYVREFADKIKQHAPDAAALQALQMLSLSPAVNPQMLDAAAELVGENQLAQDTLRMIAQKHNLDAPIMTAPEKHLRPADIAKIADDIRDAFNCYFDNHSAFIPADAPGGCGYGTPERATTETRAMRSFTRRGLESVKDGSAFKFDDTGIQAEFDAAAAEE